MRKSLPRIYLRKGEGGGAAAARLEHAAVARMGISGLLPALKNIIEPQHVRKYAGQKVAVDTVCDRMPVCERPSVVGVCRRFPWDHGSSSLFGKWPMKRGT